MGLMIKIIEIHGREILDSRGNPTVEVEVTAQTETTERRLRAGNLCHPEPVPEDLRRLSCGMDRNVILGLEYSALWITSTQRSAGSCWE